MTINNPIAFAFAAAIPIIVALYLLKLRRKKLIVSSTFFWTEMVQDLQANVPFQKIRWNILLFLQILIACAVVAAMIDLAVQANLNEGQRTIFVIDTSGSMTSTELGASRFDLAMRDLNTYSRNLAPREQVMIIEAGEQAKLLLDFTANLPAIRQVLESMEPHHTQCDLSTAFALAQSKAGDVDKPMVVVVSDFTGIESDLFQNPAYPISFLDVGAPAENVAITDFQITGYDYDPASLGVNAFLVVRNFTDQERICDVEFYVDGELTDVRSITVEAGSKEGKVYRGIPYTPDEYDSGVVEVRLEVTDDFELDNIAYALPPLAEGMSILLVGDDPFLTNALAGLPGIRLFQISESEYLPGAGYDLTFFVNNAPGNLTPGSYVFFYPPDRDYLPCSMGEQVEMPQVTDWDDGHPMLRFVNPGSFEVFISRVAEPRPGSLTLIDANSTPLMLYGERNNIRSLVFPFELGSTTLITRPTFPILMYNIVSFFRSYVESGAGSIRTQGIGPVRIEEPGERVHVTGPGGIDLNFPIDAGHAFIDVSHIGVYAVEVEGSDRDESKTIVANFFDEEESDISAKVSPESLGGSNTPQRFEVKGEKRLWKWLSVLALCVLTVEWFFYHRKGF